MLKLFVMGVVLVSAHPPSMHKTYVRKGESGCNADEGCSNISKEQCDAWVSEDDLGWDEKTDTCVMESEDGNNFWQICECEMVFKQPTNAGNQGGGSALYSDYYYGDNSGSNGNSPCGWYSMLKWDDEWNLEGTGSIDMTTKTIHNKDYFDCTEAGGEWRDVDGENEWGELSGPKYCRIKFDHYSHEGPNKPDSIDSFLCKDQCKLGSEHPMLGGMCELGQTEPQCTCNGGTSVSDWRKCFSDGNEQCEACDSPDHTPVADRNTNTVRCEPYDAFHLEDCGRTPQGMRIVGKAELAPYSVEMCAYWVKQDPQCEGDYFYTLNHLDTTDFTEKVWSDYEAHKREEMTDKQAEEFDWEGERRTFVNEWEYDFNSATNELKSNFMIHRQKKYGCHCRASQTHPEQEYLRGPFEEQEETWFGYAGNTYKFNESPTDTKDDTGPLSLIPGGSCPNYNYKIGGLTSYWGCLGMEPKPIWGWILAEQEGTKSIASPKYYRMFQHVGDVVNLANGVYSFLCYAGQGYAGEVQYKNFSPHEMTSWSQGDVSIGTSPFRHHMKTSKPGQFPVGLCANMNDGNSFTQDFNICGEHTPCQDRTVQFVIQLWEFEDGRMYYRGTEAVPKGYDAREDPRWEEYKEKFTKFYPDTQITRIQPKLGPMVARQEPIFAKCEPDDLSGIESLKQYLMNWLEDNRDEWSALEDDTKEGIYLDEKTTNGDLMVEWYLDTMFGASDNYLKCKAKDCKDILYPDWTAEKHPECNPNVRAKSFENKLVKVFNQIMEVLSKGKAETPSPVDPKTDEAGLPDVGRDSETKPLQPIKKPRPYRV